MNNHLSDFVLSLLVTWCHCHSKIARISWNERGCQSSPHMPRLTESAQVPWASFHYFARVAVLSQTGKLHIHISYYMDPQWFNVKECFAISIIYFCCHFHYLQVSSRNDLNSHVSETVATLKVMLKLVYNLDLFQFYKVYIKPRKLALFFY